MHDEAERRFRLTALIRRFYSGARQLGITGGSPDTPIQPVIIGDAEQTVALSNLLEQDGFFISAIRPPTVPRGTSRLRIALSANHTGEQVDRLLESLGRHVAGLEAGIVTGLRRK